MIKIKNQLSSYLSNLKSCIKDYKFHSMLIRYFFLMLFILIIPIVGLNVMYARQLHSEINRDTIEQNESSNEQISTRMENTLFSMKGATYSIGKTDITSYLKSHDSLRTGVYSKVSNLIEFLKIIRNSNDFYDSIYVYFEKSKDMVTDSGLSNFDDMNWYSSSIPQSNESIFLAREKYGKYPPLLSFLYGIPLADKTRGGVVVINLNAENFSKYISSNIDNGTYCTSFFMIDATSGKCIFHDNQLPASLAENYAAQLVPQSSPGIFCSEITELDGKDYAVSCYYSKQNNFYYLYLTSMEQYTSLNQKMNQRLTWIILLSIILCFIAATLLASFVYRPIRHTMELLNDFSMVTPTHWDKKTNEFEIIKNSIEKIQVSRTHADELLKEKIIHLQNSQMQALQMQINPHFMFNTLESIGNTAALLQDSDSKVPDMLFTLGRLLRISLDTENYLVTLQEELEHVKLYVKIMEFRFHGKIVVDYQIPEELKKESVVKLILQPLIENSIEHGFNRNYTNGIIRISCKKSKDDIIIEVSDNGTGMSLDELQKLRQSLQDSSINATKSIGLRNVNERLKLFFGDEYGLSLDQAQEGGLCVRITLPHIEQPVNSYTADFYKK